MKKEGRDWLPRYAEPYLTRFRIPEDRHVSPSPTVHLAGRPDQRLRPPFPCRSPGARLVQLRHGPGTLLLGLRHRPATGRLAPTEVRHRQETPARMVLRSRGQGRQAPPPTRRPHLFCPLAPLDSGRLAQQATGPGSGRHDPGATLHHAGYQCPVSRLCCAPRLADSARFGETSLEGRVAGPAQGPASPTAPGLDGHRADRPRVVCQVAVPGDPTPRLASVYADQQQGLLPPRGRETTPPAVVVGAAAGPAVPEHRRGLPGCAPAVAVYAVGPLGARICRPLAGADRPVAGVGGGVLVRAPRLDRAGLQASQERRLGLAEDAHGRSAPRAAAVVGDGGSDVVVLAGRRRRRSQRPSHGDDRPLARSNADGSDTTAGYGRAGRSLSLRRADAAGAGNQCVRAWSDGHRQYLAARSGAIAGPNPSGAVAHDGSGRTLKSIARCVTVM